MAKSTTSTTAGFTILRGANDSSYTVANPAAGVELLQSEGLQVVAYPCITAIALYYKVLFISKMAEMVVPAAAVVPFDVMAI
jgi:uncharacterized ion transporter superfamily protein YfcC